LVFISTVGRAVSPQRLGELARSACGSFDVVPSEFSTVPTGPTTIFLIQRFRGEEKRREERRSD
jgi:hypothetical protein